MNRKFEQIDWEFFSLDEIFTTIQRGKRLTKKNQIKGDIPYISSTKYNNGVDGFIGNEENVRKYSNCLTIANSGSVGNIFYHDYEFIASDHVTALVNEELVKEHYMFLIASISMIGEKYSFNREISDDRIKREKIKLPAVSPDEPDWEFMKEYIESKQEIISDLPPQVNLNVVSDERKLSDVTWDTIKISDLFEIDKTVTQVNDKELLPYISAKKMRNGLKEFSNDFTNAKAGNTITWNKIGDGGAGLAYYQETPYVVDSINVMVLKPLFNMNRYSGLFIVGILSQYHGIFGHGYTLTDKRFSMLKIKIPIIEETGRIDLEFMEQYMKKKENEVLEKH
ncbi:MULTISPECIES: restriction endonuclease subunit S [Vagococcus]|uniref:restriction endonuclease subunit S n=1 Tax=Vagococcus TaxID=2737 RepID=UPI0018F7C6CA|nr:MULTISPECIES: restriction endonuclease subunit S [Vagococcus]